MIKAETFEEWLLNNEDKLCDIDCEDIARVAWNAAKAKYELYNRR